ncbi:FAD/NAD(P)-binding domain-containing protein [Hyaloscypha bicolor E]|uniref:FAD/NAD(P)-binding domain-containing protein n=1 Tax=Hyaloscypha bicolor E TaxID=1095630 RepID=A0A2J6SQR1_9HELO|nr:FAD/NAD(P)-binding domain-containing protein [Hyaloscypha bicolor E]PMD53023.1 FAD/NAD(P)-binding domain-containing protein [Hyaloscypha bicolor E]
MSSKTPRIAIIGAGPAGLTLASLLTHNSIPYMLFDLRPPPTNASSTSPLVPSGSLDLHAESGLLALENCGLLDKLQALNRAGSEECIITDKTGEVKYSDDGQGGQRPEIARNDLTHLLLSSIPEQNVKWNHKLLLCDRSEGNGEAIEKGEDFDVVIGADGAWSRTRLLLTTEKPHFSTVSCITLTIPSISTTYPQLAAMIGNGSFYAPSDRKAVIAQRGSLDSARVYCMLSAPSESYLVASGLSSATILPSRLKKMLLENEGLFAHWGQGIKSLLAAGCDSGVEISANPLFMFPIGFSWQHVPGATVIGDAAHLMTPFAGEGVNCAMLDAFELSKGLVSAVKSGGAVEALDEQLEMFENVMWKRMRPVSEETWDNLQVIFAEDAPGGFVRVMESHGPPPEEEA